MENQKIIETIKKVLELSQNNPSKAEAQAAALKAQELLAKYHLSMSDIDTTDSDIDEIYVEVGMGNKWKYQLARIIARNFCCKHFLMGKATIVFFGHKTDIKIATRVFQTLFYMGNQLSKKEYRDAKARGEWTEGIVNSWLSGYLAGIQSVLDAQCTALVLTVPDDVKDKYTERTEGFKKSRNRNIRCNNGAVFNKGYNEGRSQMQARQIG